MLSSLRYLRFVVTLAVLGVLLTPSLSGAGWMGFRNDTKALLIIQETVPVGRSSRPGKPQKIYANETIRDTPLSSVLQRTFTISDPARPDKPLYSGRFPCPAINENVLYVIKVDAKGVLKIEAQRSPAATARSPGK